MTTDISAATRAGKKWAANPANHKQLERLLEALRSLPEYLLPFEDPSPTAAFGPFELFYLAVEPDGFGRDEAGEFWDQFNIGLPDDRERELEIVAEFCDGVLEVAD